jgi:sec-independent protein translocase protein TatB
MFPDLSWSHMLLVLVVALVVVGPKDLPKLMRTMGKWAGKARAMADQFRKSFDEMARQSELDELRKELDELRNMRPLAETERTVNEALQPPDISLASEEKPSLPPETVHEEGPKAGPSQADIDREMSPPAAEPAAPAAKDQEPRTP